MLTLFLETIDNDAHQELRVDRGVENVLVCDAMVMARGDGRGSFIPGLPHTIKGLKDYGGMCIDVYVTCIIMFFMAWKCLEFLTQKIQRICSHCISSTFHELITLWTSTRRHSTTTRYEQRITGLLPKCGSTE